MTFIEKEQKHLMKVKKWKLLESESEWLVRESESRSVVSDSCDPMDYVVHGLLQARIL